MERLTIDTKLLFCDISQCRETPGGSFCEDGYCDQRRVYERLREYERICDLDELKAIVHIGTQPTIGAVPVVHGRWVNLGFIGDKEMVGCYECHGASETKSDFCKDCGAKMDEQTKYLKEETQ